MTTSRGQSRGSDECVKHCLALLPLARALIPFFPASAPQLSAEWTAMLKTAGLDAKAYDISDPNDQMPTPRKKGESPTSAPRPPPRLLVSMNSGWRGYDLRDFVLRQPQTESVEWDQVKYTPDDLDAEGNFKGGVKGANAAPLPKGLADLGAGMGGMPPGAISTGGAPPAAATAKKRAKKVEEEEEEDDDDDEF
jgi:hypothetical protein